MKWSKALNTLGSMSSISTRVIDVGVPWSEELGHEGLGPGGEHALVRQEQLTTDLKFHICSHLAS